MFLRGIVLLVAVGSLFVDFSKPFADGEFNIPALADPLTLHVVIAVAQAAAILFFMVAMGIPLMDTSMPAIQARGHFGALVSLAMWGVCSLLHFRVMDRRTLCALEGRVMLVIAFLGCLLAAETDILLFVFYNFAFCGALSILISRLPNVFQPLRIFQTIWVTVSMTLYIVNNSSPAIRGGNVSTHKIYMHMNAVGFLWISVYFKMHAHYERAGVALIAAAYDYFGGQVGACTWAQKMQFMPGTFALLWNMYAMFWVCVYLIAFAPFAEDTQVKGGTTSLITGSSDYDEGRAREMEMA